MVNLKKKSYNRVVYRYGFRFLFCKWWVPPPSADGQERGLQVRYSLLVLQGAWSNPAVDGVYAFPVQQVVNAMPNLVLQERLINWSEMYTLQSYKYLDSLDIVNLSLIWNFKGDI